MAVPDKTAAASPIGLIGVGAKKRAQFRLNRLRKQIPRALAQQIGQRVG